MVPPAGMCRRHLLGEHVETHMFLGTLKKGNSIAGFLAKGLLEPESLKSRHDELAAELLARGYAHRSPMEGEEVGEALKTLGAKELSTKVDSKTARDELYKRCEECRTRKVRKKP